MTRLGGALRRTLQTTLLLTLLASVLALAPALAQDGSTVEVFNVGYSPEELSVEVGDTVTFDWAGGTHTVAEDGCTGPSTSDDGCYVNAAGEAFNSGRLSGADSTFAFTFDEPGTYAYFCSIHSTPDGTAQNGTITVTTAGEEPPVGEEPPAEEEPPVEPPSSTDPVENALTWTARVPDGGATSALLGTAAAFADSLASGGAQAADRPLLLTPSTSLDPRTADELERLGVTDITVLGGAAAIADDVVADLERMGYTVTREFGPTRVETAIEIAGAFQPEATTAILARATGEGTAAFADSLGAGALAAANGWPILLTPTDALHPGVDAYLQAGPIDTVIIAGGTAAISDGVADSLRSLGITVDRRAGGSRFGTAAALYSGGEGTPVVVDGADDLAWTSGFAAAAFAPAGIVLSSGEMLPAPTVEALFGAGSVTCGPLVAAAACELAEAAVTVGEPLVAVMDGQQEVPPNDAGASGLAQVHPTTFETIICVRSRMTGLTGPLQAGHIHAGAFGEAGDVVIPLPTADPESEEAGTFATGCVRADAAAVADVFADPGEYYVNFHTEANPAGEVRGQLQTTAGSLSASLSGDAEVPGPGDPDGTGTASVYPGQLPDQLCYVVEVVGLTPPIAAAHIHDGAADEAGPVVVPLQVGEWENRAEASGDLGSDFAACTDGLDEALVADILANPSEYYVNLHNEPFPAGALRGQLG